MDHKSSFNWALIYGLIGCFRFKLSNLTCLITNICNRTSQIRHLRAAACKSQTSSDSSKKSTSILFHQKIPYKKLFSKMELKFFSEFYFLRNRALSDFAQTGLGVTFKIGKFCKCSAASQSKSMKKRKLSFISRKSVPSDLLKTDNWSFSFAFSNNLEAPTWTSPKTWSFRLNFTLNPRVKISASANRFFDKNIS